MPPITTCPPISACRQSVGKYFHVCKPSKNRQKGRVLIKPAYDFCE
jgi:hypothetical protein